MYPDRGDISAPVNPDISMSNSQSSSPVCKDTPLLRLRNGALQAGLNDRLQRVVAARKVSELLLLAQVFSSLNYTNGLLYLATYVMKKASKTQCFKII